jgi:26S proteasome regulatory subunit T4
MVNPLQAADPEKHSALLSFKKKIEEVREWEDKLKTVRLEVRNCEKTYNQTEENLKALQSVGQIIGEVLKQLDEERCRSNSMRCAF